MTNYIYAKRYHDVGATVNPLGSTDLFLTAVAVDPTVTSGDGFTTMTNQVGDLTLYTIGYINQNHGLQTLSLGKGILGDGSVTNPWALDLSFLKNNYTSANSWPFSMVGVGSLPIIGDGGSMTITVTSAIPVYMGGISTTITPKSYNLTTLLGINSPTTVYVYARSFAGQSDLVFSTTVLDEWVHQHYLGTVTTTSSNIANVNCNPIYLWEMARPASSNQGCALPTSQGAVTDTQYGVWSYNSLGVSQPNTGYPWTVSDRVSANPIPQFDVTITGQTTLYQDQTLSLGVSILPTTNISVVQWMTSDPTIATVSTSGVVTGLGVGNVIISALVNGSYTGSFELSVQPITVSLSNTTPPMVGRTITLTPTLSVAGILVTSTHWSVDQPNIATIDNQGNLTGVAVGTVNVACIINGRYRVKLPYTIQASTVTQLTLTGTPIAQETYQGQSITVYGSINLYRYFVNVMGRTPNPTEAITLTIQNNQALVGNDTQTPAITIDSNWLSTNQIAIVNQGYIFGRGASVSNVYDFSHHLSQSTNGGDAIVNQTTNAIYIDNQGWIAGGGGAGGYGSGNEVSDATEVSPGGGAPYGLSCTAYDTKGVYNATFSNAGGINYIHVYGASVAGSQSIYSGSGGAWGQKGLDGSNGYNGHWTMGTNAGYALKGSFSVTTNTGYIQGVNS